MNNTLKKENETSKLIKECDLKYCCVGYTLDGRTIYPGDEFYNMEKDQQLQIFIESNDVIILDFRTVSNNECISEVSKYANVRKYDVNSSEGHVIPSKSRVVFSLNFVEDKPRAFLVKIKKDVAIRLSKKD